MIQRIQSLYLLAALLTSGVVAFLLPLFMGSEGALPLSRFPIFGGGYALSALLSGVALFRYRNRQNQVVLCRLNIIVNFLLLGGQGWYWYQQFAARPEALGYGFFLPILVVILLVLANRAIMRDELLVRSMDRLR